MEFGSLTLSSTKIRYFMKQLLSAAVAILYVARIDMSRMQLLPKYLVILLQLLLGVRSYFHNPLISLTVPHPPQHLPPAPHPLQHDGSVTHFYNLLVLIIRRKLVMWWPSLWVHRMKAETTRAWSYLLLSFHSIIMHQKGQKHFERKSINLNHELNVSTNYFLQLQFWAATSEQQNSFISSNNIEHVCLWRC